jgi:hypothetical protein
MFEHYLQHQVPDSRRRWRVALAVNIAGFATAGLLSFTWLMDKMMIAQVTPPTPHFVMVQMAMESLPPPPPPPAAPATRPEPEVEPEPGRGPADARQTASPRPCRAPGPGSAKVIGNGLPNSKGTLPFGGPPGLPASSAASPASRRDHQHPRHAH